MKFDEEDYSDNQSMDEDEVWNAISKSTDLPKELNVVEDDSDAELENIEYTDDSEDDASEDEVEFDEADLEGLEDELDEDDDLEVDGPEEEDHQDEDDGSDNEMAAFFQDEDDDLEDDLNEKPSAKPQQGVKRRRAVDKMLEKAQALGYKGSYFVKEAPASAFASADDFAQLIANDAADANDEDEDSSIQHQSLSKKHKKTRRNQ